jgi:putative ABC transport system permease protein
VFRRRRPRRDFDDEIEAHLQLEAERLREEGRSEEEARAAALRVFGNVTEARERFYEAGRTLWWDHLRQDAGFGLRVLARSPAFAATAVLTLALGIGANTVIFSAVQAVLLAPLPFKDPDRLVFVRKKNPPRGWTDNPVSPAEVLAWRAQAGAFADLAAFTGRSCVLTGTGEAEEDPCQVASSNLFPLLGAEPLRGRLFSPEEDGPGAPPAAILGYGLWQRRFGGEEAVVGRAIVVNGESTTVVGVMPASFSRLYGSPYAPFPELWISGIALSPSSPWNDYFAVGRLRPGADLRRAQAEMDAASARLEPTIPDLKGWRAQLTTLRALVSGDARPALLVLMGAVALVLLIACANLANLLLARGAARAGEFALRRALGAGRARIVRQLLTESLLLALLGGGLGVLLALLGCPALAAAAPPVLARAAPGLAAAAVDRRVLGFVLALAAGTALLFGLFPALQSARTPLAETLKETGRRALSGPRGRRLRSALVVSEIALAMVLLVGAGLMVRTLTELHRVDLGFRAAGVLTLRLPLNGTRHQDPEARIAFWREVVAAVRALPGVEAASTSRGLPIGDWSGQYFVTAERPDPPPGQVPDANYVVAGPQYFRVLGIPVRKGRAFDDRDTASGVPVVIVNEDLARRQWPGEDPIGKRIRVGPPTAPWRTVVGVAADVRSQGYTDVHSETYVPDRQFPWLVGGPQHLLVHLSEPAGADAVARAVVRAIHGVDPDQPVTEVRMLEEAAGELVAQSRLVMALLVAFAGAALILAASGVYGVLSYSIAQRTREIGLRVALGADRGRVMRLVMAGGVRPAALGIALGISGALLASGLLRDLLFGVRATDAVTFGAATLVLAAAALLACWVPARRALRVDPAVALRCE